MEMDEVLVDLLSLNGLVHQEVPQVQVHALRFEEMEKLSLLIQLTVMMEIPMLGMAEVLLEALKQDIHAL